MSRHAPGPSSEPSALNRRTWLGITGAGLAGGLARAVAVASRRPGGDEPQASAERQRGSRSPA